MQGSAGISLKEPEDGVAGRQAGRAVADVSSRYTYAGVLPAASRTGGMGQKARQRFGCRRENGRHVVPSASVIRDCLVCTKSASTGRDVL